jgi:hypothetical protein
MSGGTRLIYAVQGGNPSGEWGGSDFGAPVFGKLEGVIFEEVVHQDAEFAHDCGQGHEWWFSCRAQTQVKFFENAVVPHGAQSSHVKGLADSAASATDMVQAILTATVAVARRDPGQGGGGLSGEFSKFGHFREHGGGDDRADAGNGVETFGFAGQFRILGDQGGDGLVTLGNLFFQDFAQLLGLAPAEGIGVMLGMVALGDEQLEELEAALGQVHFSPAARRLGATVFDFGVQSWGFLRM